MKIDLENYVVRDNTGNVDIQQTMSKFETDLNSVRNQFEAENVGLADVVNSILTSHNDQTVHMPFLIQKALVALNAQPENINSLSDRIRLHVRANASLKREDGKLYRVVKGRSSGIKLWSLISDNK